MGHRFNRFEFRAAGGAVRQVAFDFVAQAGFEFAVEELAEMSPYVFAIHDIRLAAGACEGVPAGILSIPCDAERGRFLPRIR